MTEERKTVERKVYTDPYAVAEKLRTNSGVSITDKNITIAVPSLGIKAWGLVDFLVNYSGYKLTIVHQRSDKK